MYDTEPVTDDQGTENSLGVFMPINYKVITVEYFDDKIRVADNEFTDFVLKLDADEFKKCIQFCALSANAQFWKEQKKNHGF